MVRRWPLAKKYERKCLSHKIVEASVWFGRLRIEGRSNLDGDGAERRGYAAGMYHALRSC